MARFRLGLQEMFHSLARTEMMGQSQFHGRLNLLPRILSVEHEHGDKILDAHGFSLTCLESGQELFQRRRPRFPPTAQRTGAMEGPWPLLNQLQVVVRVKLPFVVTKEPWVSGELFAVREDLQACLLYTSPSPRDGL